MSNRAQYWARLVAAWERSGLTQAEFCRRQGVKAVTFAWWKGKLSGTAGLGHRRGHRPTARGRRAAAKFAEVLLPSRVSAAGAPMSVAPDVPLTGYEIVLANGSLIRLPSAFDPKRVSQLIGLVASAC